MEWMIYGANGYTGALIAREAKRRGSAPILAGRAAAKITELARELGLPSRVFSLDEPLAIAAALQGAGLVLNCAGPFSKTADLMMRACLAAKAHYLDITGEIDVLEGVHRYDADAKSAGVILCPGVGFDVTPTDCIALMLKTALPEAHELALGFESDHRMSPGTAKTLVEGLGKSGKIRRGGRLIDLPIGRGCRDIDFGRGPKRAMPIPWGDVASAFYTTGILNITVFTPVASPLLTMVACQDRRRALRVPHPLRRAAPNEAPPRRLGAKTLYSNVREIVELRDRAAGPSHLFRALLQRNAVDHAHAVESEMKLCEYANSRITR